MMDTRLPRKKLAVWGRLTPRYAWTLTNQRLTQRLIRYGAPGTATCTRRFTDLLTWGFDTLRTVIYRRHLLSAFLVWIIQAVDDNATGLLQQKFNASSILSRLQQKKKFPLVPSSMQWPLAVLLLPEHRRLSWQPVDRCMLTKRNFATSDYAWV